MTALATQKLEIRIGNRVALGVDGRQLRLGHLAEDGSVRSKARDPYITGLRDLNAALFYHGVIRPWEVQSHVDAEAMIRDRLEQRATAYSSRRQHPMVLIFGQGDFVLQENRLGAEGTGGDWTLQNPARNIARIVNRTGDDVGFYPNPAVAIWKVVERKLFCQPVSIDYSDLSRHVFELADELTSDLKIGRAR